MSEMKADMDCQIIKIHVKSGSFMNSLKTTCLSVKSIDSNDIKKITPESKGVIQFHCTEGQNKSKGDLLFSLGPCDHPVEYCGLCAICGSAVDKKEDVFNLNNTNDRYAICPGNKHASVNEEMAMEYSLQDTISLLRKRKLVLLVDLDLTILQTSHIRPPSEFKDVFEYKLKDDANRYLPTKHYTKLRPGCMKFLSEMNELFQMQIFTFGNKSYAKTIQEKIDPTKKIFVDRVTSRDDSLNMQKKTENLKSLFPRGDHMVCIIDDRTEVWNDAPNLIHVKPYIVFPSCEDINNPYFRQNTNTSNNEKTFELKEDNKGDESSINKDLDDLTGTKNTGNESNEFIDNDDFLFHLTKILRNIHKKYYEEYDRISKEESDKSIIQSGKLPHVKDIMISIKSSILKGCRIAMSGIVRQDKSSDNNGCVKILRKLGGLYQEKIILPHIGEMTDKENYQDKLFTSHLVCYLENTDKVRKGCYYVKKINKLINEKSDKLPKFIHRLHVVSQEWLWKSYFLWERTLETECQFYPQICQLPPPEGHEELQQTEDSNITCKLRKRKHNSSEFNESKRHRCQSPSSNEDLMVELDECLQTEKDIVSINNSEQNHEKSSSTDSDTGSSSSCSSSSNDSDINTDAEEAAINLIEDNFMLRYSLDMQKEMFNEIDEAIYEERQEKIKNAKENIDNKDSSDSDGSDSKDNFHLNSRQQQRDSNSDDDGCDIRGRRKLYDGVKVDNDEDSSIDEDDENNEAHADIYDDGDDESCNSDTYRDDLD